MCVCATRAASVDRERRGDRKRAPAPAAEGWWGDRTRAPAPAARERRRDRTRAPAVCERCRGLPPGPIGVLFARPAMPAHVRSEPKHHPRLGVGMPPLRTGGAAVLSGTWITCLRAGWLRPRARLRPGLRDLPCAVKCRAPRFDDEALWVTGEAPSGRSRPAPPLISLGLRCGYQLATTGRSSIPGCAGATPPSCYTPR